MSLSKLNSFSKFQREMHLALKSKYGEMKLISRGNSHAKVVLIGQAPSISGIKSQKPFLDKSGDRLRDKWFLVSKEEFYNPELFYITAMGMYFPGKDKKGGDKKPDLKWAEEWLRKEVTYLHPKLFILIGRMAAEFFFPKQKFENLIFNDQLLQNTKTLVLPHPSPANIRWFVKHPEFEKERVPVIREYVQEVLK